MNHNKKNKLYFWGILIIILTYIFIKHRIVCYNSKNLNYAAEHYLTSSIFNTNKLHNVDTFHLKFSDGNIAIMEIHGMRKKSPHKKVSYKLFLEKNSHGCWKVKKTCIIP